MTGLRRLRALSIVGTKMTEGGLSKLKRAIPRCVVKTDAGTADVVDSELKARAELERLGVRIRLDENGDALAVSLGKGVVFTDKEIEHLKWMIDLKQLSLNGGNVTDAGLGHLGGLTKLEVLDLCNTKITDAWRDAMPELPKLAWLDLRGTKVTDAGFASCSICRA